ncbi:carbohydrate-binding protein, partial [Streptomyces sp. MCAF7]
MRSTSNAALPGRRLGTVVVLALTAQLATTVPAAQAETEAPTTPAATTTTLATKPYLGWTSWTMQSSKYPGLNPKGDYSYLTEANVDKQT